MTPDEKALLDRAGRIVRDHFFSNRASPESRTVALQLSRDLIWLVNFESRRDAEEA